MSDVLNSDSAPACNTYVQAAGPSIVGAANTSTRQAELSHMQRWLRWQCRKIPGVIRAAVYAVNSASGKVDDASHGASFPDAIEDPAALLTLANAALLRKASVAKCISTQGENARQIDCLSVPLPAGDARFVFVLLMGSSGAKQRQALSELIVWGSDWLIEPEKPATSNPQASQALLNKYLGAGDLRHLAHEFVNQVSEHFSAERVSLGLLKQRSVSVEVISGLALFDRRMEEVVGLRAAMQEALDLHQSVSTDNCTNSLLHNHHRSLIGDRQLVVDTVLLEDEQGVIGALTMERHKSPEAVTDAAQTLIQLAIPFTPLLRLHREAERGFVRRLIDDGSAFCRQLFARDVSGGFVKPARLVSLSLLIIGLLGLFILPGQYRVTSGATIEGSGKQVLVAPFEGFIRAAHARAGDTVEQGAIIAELDTGALEIQQRKWQSELEKIEKSYSQSLAAGDRSELSLLNAVRDELEAELALVEQRLQRSVLRAPYPGVLVSGDLHQLLGAPVEMGQALFEISSLDEFRLMLDIDEQTIASVKTGQVGTVRLASMPDVKYDIKLKNLQPVATVVDGRNVFRMEAELLNPDTSVRPGMTGVAKISAGQRSWIWLWTHTIVNRLRVWSWSLGFGE